MTAAVDEGSGEPAPAAEAPVTDATAEADAKLKAQNALAQLQAKLANAAENTDAAPAEAAPTNGDAQPKLRKKRFGPPANAPREIPKRKRRSRWETNESNSTALTVQSGRSLWPTDVTLPGGVTVRVQFCQASGVWVFDSHGFAVLCPALPCGTGILAQSKSCRWSCHLT